MNALSPSLLAATTALSSVAAPTGSDAMLIALCADSVADRRAYAALWRPFYLTSQNHKEHDRLIREARPFLDRALHTEGLIAKLTATTLEGLLAKAAAVRHRVMNDPDHPDAKEAACYTGDEEEGDVDQGEFAWLFVQDAEAFLRRQTAGSRADVGADAALIDACDEHVRRMTIYNANPEDSGPLFASMMETHDLIMKSEPQTMAGLLALARAARIEGVNDGDDLAGAGTTWGWNTAMGLLRLMEGRMQGPAVPVAVPPGADIELIRTCQAYPALIAAYNASADDNDKAEMDALDAATAIIQEARPQTLAGVLAKAAAAKAEAHLSGDAPELEARRNDGAAWCWHVVNDLLDLHRPAPVQARHADDGLTALANQHIANKHVLDHGDLPDDSPELDAYSATFVACKAAQPTDLQGFIAMARVAWAEMHVKLDGTLYGLPSSGDQMARQLVQHLMACPVALSDCSPSADADLLAACASFDRLEHHANALYGNDMDDDERDVLEAPFREQQDALLDTICDVPAVTQTGRDARLRTLKLYEDNEDDRLLNSACTNQRLLGAVLRDVPGGVAR